MCTRSTANNNNNIIIIDRRDKLNVVWARIIKRTYTYVHVYVQQKSLG